MKFVLMLLGVVLAALGIAVGVISQKDFGVALIGLNLGVAATLLSGGLIVLGLGALISTMDTVLQKLRLAAGAPKTPAASHAASAYDTTPPPPPVKKDTGPGVGTAVAGAGALAAGSLAASMQKAGAGVDNAIDEVAKAASEAKDTTVNLADKAGDKVVDVVANVTEKTGEVGDAAKQVAQDAGDAVAKAADTAKDTAAEAKDTVVDAVTKTGTVAVDTATDAADTVTGAVKDTSDEVTAVLEDTAADVEADKAPDTDNDAAGDTQVAGEESAISEDAADVPEDVAGDDGQLYVVEELVIRGRSARTLSDGTLEAETAEGWMRFENAEHLEEYLDAMEG